MNKSSDKTCTCPPGYDGKVYHVAGCPSREREWVTRPETSTSDDSRDYCSACRFHPHTCGLHQNRWANRGYGCCADDPRTLSHKCTCPAGTFDITGYHAAGCPVWVRPVTRDGFEKLLGVIERLQRERDAALAAKHTIEAERDAVKQSDDAAFRMAIEERDAAIFERDTLKTKLEERDKFDGLLRRAMEERDAEREARIKAERQREAFRNDFELALNTLRQTEATQKAEREAAITAQRSAEAVRPYTVNERVTEAQAETDIVPGWVPWGRT